MDIPLKNSEENSKLATVDILSSIEEIENEFDNFLQYLEPPSNLNSLLDAALSQYPTMQVRNEFQIAYAFETKNRVKKSDALFMKLIKACCLRILDIREARANENWKQAFTFLINVAELLGRLKMLQLHQTSTARIKITSNAGRKKNAERLTLATLLIEMIEINAVGKKFSSVSELINSIDSDKSVKLLADFTRSCQECGSSYPIPLDENLPDVINRMMNDLPDFGKRISVFLNKK